MASIFDKRPSFGWSRGQRFQLTSAGAEAEVRYREAVTAARAVPGRVAFEAARAEWAARLGLDPSDGPCLGELMGGARADRQIAEGLASCGATLDEVRIAVTRLVQKGLVEAAAPPEEPPSRRRW